MSRYRPHPRAEEALTLLAQAVAHLRKHPPPALTLLAQAVAHLRKHPPPARRIPPGYYRAFLRRADRVLSGDAPQAGVETPAAPPPAPPAPLARPKWPSGYGRIEWEYDQFQRGRR